MGERKKITVITCAYNEEDCIEELARRLCVVFDSIPQFDFEVIAIENGSTDHTFEKMLEARQRDRRFKIVQFSRNFGLHGGFSAGLDLADGDAAVIMAADLQDPPEVLPELIAKWEEGFLNVYGVVSERPTTPFLRRVNSRLFYWLFTRLSEQPLPPHARDFRLLDRKVYEQVRKIDDPQPFHRALASWPGFPSTGVRFVEPPRFAGTTKSISGPVIELAVRAIFSQSLTPLRVMPVVGLFLTGGSIAGIIGLAVNSIANGVPFPGFGTLMAVMLMLFGILFCLLSVLGIYIGLIFEKVQQRPRYIIDNQVGFNEGESG